MRRALCFCFSFTVTLAFGCSDEAGAPPAQGTGSIGGPSNDATATGTTGSATSSATAVTDTSGSPMGATTTTAAATSGGTGSSTGGAMAVTSSVSSTGFGGASSTMGAGGATGAGAAGMTGAGGASSSTGSAGTGGTSPTMDSSGCGMPAQQATGEWVEQTSLNIQGTERIWSIRLPDNYEPTRAYPLVVQLHGCGSGTNNVPVERASGDDAIQVRGTAAQNDVCWNTSTNGPNIEFFDAMVDGVATSACVDENRIFAAGYSSGSWLISVLACLRGDRLRAVGTVAGGNALFGSQECTGTVAQIFIHDQNDTENQWSNHEAAMERLIEVNGCSPDAPVAEPPEPCVRYQGCTENPVKFCPTTGQGHNRQDDYASAAFWDFFSEF